MRNYLDKFSLKNRVVFVTGGVGLIGAEISKALAVAGAKTIILDIDRKKGISVEKEIVDSGYQAHYEYFDITKLKDLKKGIDRLIKNLPHFF